MTHEASRMRVLVIRGRRVNSLLLARERSRGLLLREGFMDRAATIKAKAKISHPKMGDTLELLASHGRGHATNMHPESQGLLGRTFTLCGISLQQ